MTNDAISLHKKLRGKIFVGSKIRSLKLSDIELIYTPGVASVSKEIFHNPDQRYALTSKGNNVGLKWFWEIWNRLSNFKEIYKRNY